MHDKIRRYFKASLYKSLNNFRYSLFTFLKSDVKNMIALKRSNTAL